MILQCLVALRPSEENVRIDLVLLLQLQSENMLGVERVKET